MVADHVARRVLDIVTAALVDIEAVVDVHADMAPVSTGHVQRFTATMAGTTLGWLQEWPS